MRPLITLALVCSGFAVVVPVSANTLRCGPVLIEPGDDAGYVLENCGEPNSPPELGPASADWARLQAPPGAFRANNWRYDRGPGKFPAVVVIGDDGRVAAIRFEKERRLGQPEERPGFIQRDQR